VGHTCFRFAYPSLSNQERTFGRDKPERKIGCFGQTKLPFATNPDRQKICGKKIGGFLHHLRESSLQL